MRHVLPGMLSFMAAAFLLPAPPAPAETVRLVEDFDATWRMASEARWQFSNGAEFPGAAGSFDRSKDAAHAGAFGGRLAFDFSGGGNYVAAILRLQDAPAVGAVRLWIRKPAGNGITFRCTDSGGQTLQKGVDVPDNAWAEIAVDLDGWQAHWGGANDGVLHGPTTMIHLLVENTGDKTGAVLIDDIRLVEGKAAKPVYPCAFRFEPSEGWHAWGAKAKLDGRSLAFDFAGGGAVSLSPREVSLPGTPKRFVLRYTGDLAGRHVRLSLATHFMTFDGPFGAPAPATAAPGEAAPPAGAMEIAAPAPPGPGWTWVGGENDGKLHGPLRLGTIAIGAGDKGGPGAIELLEFRVEAEAPARKLVLVHAELREKEGGAADFTAVMRSLAPAPVEAKLAWQIRNWAGKILDEGSRPVTLPPGARTIEAAVLRPAGDHAFLEAEFTLTAEGQDIPVVQAYHVAPLPLPEGEIAPDPASPFGMGLYLNRYGGDARGLEEMGRAARVGAAAGVKWTREDFSWGRIEPAKGRFDWAFYDALVATAKRNGVSVYGILCYWSPWTKPYTPEGIDDYCRYVRAVVEHYKADIRHWEIWNEPNIFFWQGPKDLYVDLLKRAHAEIKAVDPGLQVLGCSTAGIDSAFIKRVMGLGGPFDILTIHPYRARLDDAGFARELRKVADLVKTPEGKDRPVWITEMGWATHVLHNSLKMDFAVTTQRRQAELLVRAYVDAIAAQTAPNISWYDFRNDGTDPYNFEHHMGIVQRDFRPKPSYRAYATMTRLLRGLAPQGPVDLGEGVVAHRFGGFGGGNAICLWSLDGDKSVAVPLKGHVTLTGLMGDTERLEREDGGVTVNLRTGVPVFLKEAAR
jgi:hypothetical protein